MEKDYLSRRNFLKATVGVLVSLPIVNIAKGNESFQKIKKNLLRRLTEEEELQFIAKINWKTQQLYIWMNKNSEAIFAKAPHNEIYAVGVWREKRPEIHYFDNKGTGVLPFMHKAYDKGDRATNFIYRHQKDLS